MGTNLYDFLRKLLTNGGICQMLTNAERQWLELFLENPDTEISFKSRETGNWKVLDDLSPELAEQYIEHGKQVDGKPAEPEVNINLAIKGLPDDVFCLLTEAMIQCPGFAALVIGAAKFHLQHVPDCPYCGNHHEGRAPSDCPDFENPHVWEFYNRKQQTNEKGRTTDTQRQTGRGGGSDKAASPGQ